MRKFSLWLKAHDREYNKFKTKAGLVMTLNNATRWNSWYTMLKRAIETKHTVAAFMLAHDKSCSEFTLDAAN